MNSINLPWHSSADGHRRRRTEKAHVDTRSGKGGLLRRHGDVTAGDKLATGCRGNAIHHGDYRNRYVLYQSHYLMNKSYTAI